MNHFSQLAKIDVSKLVDKKNNLDYLSWPHAVNALMEHDPAANWEFLEPRMFGETMMVYCTVTAFGKPITMHLPVMDHRGQPVKNPDAVVVNKNMMRCLVKAIACHGLGLSVYAGEDLPTFPDPDTGEVPPPPPKPEKKVTPPAKIEGKPGAWQLSVTAEPTEGGENDWIKVVFDATRIALGLDQEATDAIWCAQSEADVMAIFRNNKNIYDRVKTVHPDTYTELLDEFKQAKARFTKEAK